jgi:uncharacterized protein YneF (UPF0154 family)
MKKLFLWILVFIQPLLIAIATGFACAILLKYFDDPGPRGGIVVLAFFQMTAIIGLIPGIFISVKIYQKHLSSKKSED